MDKWQAQQDFWGSFSIPAYDEQTIYTEGQEPSFPHITYEAFGGVMGQTSTLNASLWYKTTSWADVKRKADEILAYMQTHRTIIEIEGGYLWLKVPESAFARPFSSGSQDIKRILLTIEAECLTNV